MTSGWVACALGLAGGVALAACQQPKDSVSNSGPSGTESHRVSTLQPLAWLSGSGSLIIARTDQVVAGNAGRVACDSTALYTVSDGSVPLVWHRGSLACSALAFAPSLAVRPDGKALGYTELAEDCSGTLHQLVIGARAATTLVRSGVAATGGFAWSPDARRLAFVGCDSLSTRTALRLSSSTGEHVRTVGQPENWVAIGHPSWSPDGRQIAATRGVGEVNDSIAVVDVATGALTSIAAGRLPSWSTTGSEIAYLKVDATNQPRAIRLIRPDGGGDRELFRLSGAAAKDDEQDDWITGPLVWSPDGARIAFGRRSAVWVVTVRTMQARALVELADR